MRRAFAFGLGVAWGVAASTANAAPALIAASDPSRIAEVQLAKVAADRAPLWLSVRTSGQTELALVTSQANVESAANADAWLRALDFSTRVRVSPPPGLLATCATTRGNLADSGMPEPLLLEPERVTSAASELELRRALEAAGIALDLDGVATFTASVNAPYRVAFYDASDEASSTAALRIDDSAALAVSGVVTSGRQSLPLSLIVLGTSAILPASTDLAEPGDFAVKYFGAKASTDYVAARAAFLERNPLRFVVEVEAASSLLAWSVIPGAGVIEPAASHYFEAALGQENGHSCFIRVESAYARQSVLASDYTCGDADDFALAAGAFEFADLRLTRVFGSIDGQGLSLRSSDDSERDGHVVATDFDASDCATNMSVMPGADGSVVPSDGASTPVTPVNSGSASGVRDSSSEETSSVSPGDSCDVTVFSDSCDGDSSSSTDTSSSDSCSGDSSSGSDSSSSDSCSGDSSSDSDQSDSCSGDSSSDSDQSDSCSGDSSSTDSSDSSGCGSGYDGDTCSGNSASSAAAESKSAALEPASAAVNPKQRKRLHLSLITLFSAALALPLRRLKTRHLVS